MEPFAESTYEVLLEYMMENGFISKYEAEELGIPQLDNHIFMLGMKGYKINRKWVWREKENGEAYHCMIYQLRTFKPH